MKAGPEPLIFLCFLVVVIGSVFWHNSRSISVLENWARENNFDILEREQRLWFKGPFFWTTSRGQTVYHVTVRDNNGAVRSGWVRCGGWFLGLMSDHAEVRWEQ